MDDYDSFLGTSIQYSEQQIKLLEQEHAANLEKTVDDLIKSGFLDSDYDEESTETEYSDNELSELSDNEELKENIVSPSVSSLNELSEYELSEELKSSDNLALILVSDISVVDDIVSNTDNINDTESMTKYYYDDDDEREEYYDDEDDILLSKTMKHLIEIIVSFLIIFMVSFNSNILQNDFDGECGGQQQQQQFLRQTSIHWFLEPSSTQKPIINDNDNENENEEEDEKDNNQQHHVLNFDIRTTTLDTNTNKVYQQHRIEFKITPFDLLCDDDPSNNNIPQQIPRLFLQFGAGLKFKSPQMMRIFKETVSETMGRQFARTHGLTALVMSFVGIAAFAASSGIDEFVAISS